MANLGEIEKAVKIIENEGNSKIVILHCVAIYPTENKDLNLKNITMLQNTFGYPVGFSDHSLGFVASLTSVALGACIIEKHFTINREMDGPDHKASLEPDELKEMVKSIRHISNALGSGQKKPSESELKNREIARKSIHIKKALSQGHILTEDDLIMKRPGNGISPMVWRSIIGKSLRVDVQDDHLLLETDIK